MIKLPKLPQRDLLADLCREVSRKERVPAAAVEKDFFLTRIIWGLAQERGDKLLLKGGTLLSKVDLGFHRMSEDVDLVLPLKGRAAYKPANARAMNEVRDALRAIAPVVGVGFPHPDGERFDRHSHVIWTLPYETTFGPQAITVEVSLRPLLRPVRRAPIMQLLVDPLIGDYRDAYCFALDADEARAEKVRAAFTRTAGRDFYDLNLMLKHGAHFGAASFVTLVDAKLAELKHPPIHEHEVAFGMNEQRRLAVEASFLRDLPAVLRVGDAAPDLDELLKVFARKWNGKRKIRT